MKARSEEYVLRSFLTRKEDWFFVKRLLPEVSDIGSLTLKMVSMRCLLYQHALSKMYKIIDI